MGVGALADVRELLRVAEQDDAAGALGDGDRVGERHLAGLVDEEHVDGLVHVLARPQPGRAGVEQDSSSSAGGCLAEVMRSLS